MVIEHGTIHVIAGREEAFEEAYAEAAKVIARSPGFRFVRLCRGIERPSTYLLLVGWDRLEDHTVGFRESELFTQWRGWIGPFFDGVPQVEHYAGDISGLPVGG